MAARHIADIVPVDEPAGSMKGQYIDDQYPAQAHETCEDDQRKQKLMLRHELLPLNFI
jgi:hypothetical protein